MDFVVIILYLSHYQALYVNFYLYVLCLENMFFDSRNINKSLFWMTNHTFLY